MRPTKHQVVGPHPHGDGCCCHLGIQEVLCIIARELKRLQSAGGGAATADELIALTAKLERLRADAAKG